VRLDRDLDRRTPVVAKVSWRLAGWTCAAALACVVPSVSAGQQVRTTVRGVVYDSVNQRHLADAVVQLARADQPHVSRSVRTDGAGAFAFDSVEAGTWLLGFFHPVLDSLDLTSPLVHLTIREPSPVHAMLAVPSPQAIVRQRCGDAGDSTGLWYGRTRSALTGRGVGGATVLAQWVTIVATRREIRRETPSVAAESGADGTFAICGMPVDEVVLARGWAGADSSGVVTLTLPRHRLLRRDVLVAPVTTEERPLPGDTTVRVAVPVGTGRVRGRVVRRDGAPVAGARLRFSASAVEAVSGTSGHFAFDSLPLGTHTIDLRAIGYLQAVRAVDVVPFEVTTEDFVLEPRAAYLDTVRVVGERVWDSPQYQEFLRRKRNGFGYYYDEDDLERRDPMYVSDVLRMTPGVTVMPGGFGGRIMFRSTSFRSAYCSPAIFLDGMRLGDIEDLGLDTFVSARDVRGLEVYPRTAGMPAQYQTMTGCGSIVIWTGARRKRQLPP
jgi:hypothetical protein